jgi:hypothetical protein
MVAAGEPVAEIHPASPARIMQAKLTDAELAM